MKFAKIKNFILKNNNILSALCAIFATTGLFLQFNLITYNVYYVVFLLVFLLLYKNINYSSLSKIQIKCSFILTIIFSLILIIGKVTYNNLTNPIQSVIFELFNFHNIIGFVGNIFLLFPIIVFLILFFYKIQIYDEQNINKNVKRVFIICVIIIFCCWLPYFLSCYPGNLTNDSLSQLKMIIDGFANLSNHHPIIHTLFIGIFYNIGYLFTKSVTASVAIVIIVQMLIMASIFSYLIIFLYKRKVNKKILFGILCFYSLLPVFGFYSITMWKDVLFAGLFVLFQTVIIKLLENENYINKKLFIEFIIVSLLMIFFRNNAVYMYFIFIVFALIILRKQFKKLMFGFLIVLTVYFSITGPVFHILDIKKSGSAEYIAIPLQQVGRMVYKNVNFTKTEKKYINKLMPIEAMKKSYDPIVSDGIKFNKEYNAEAFDKNKREYFNIWLNLVIEHPSVAIESYLCSTLGYWYPNVDYWAVASYIEKDNEFNLEQKSLLPEIVSKGIKKLDSKQIPLLNLEWSIGLLFWIALFMLVVTFILNKKKNILIFIPSIGIWITMMIATPVFAEYRYIFCVFASLPILILAPYLHDKKLVNKRSKKDEKK